MQRKQTRLKRSCLGDAIFNEDDRALREALKPKKNASEEDKSWALWRSVASGYKKGVKILLDSGAQARWANASEILRKIDKERFGATALMIAAHKGNDLSTLELLLPHSDIDAADAVHGRTALMHAVLSVGPEAAQCLAALAKASDLSKKDANGDTAWALAKALANSAAQKALEEQMAVFEAAALKAEVEGARAIFHSQSSLASRLNGVGAPLAPPGEDYSGANEAARGAESAGRAESALKKRRVRSL